MTATGSNIEGAVAAAKAGGEVYFIGIGGIGMSALARYFHAQGARVSGYDKTPTTLTSELEKSGIAIHYTDDVTLAPKDAALVVYTPAVPKNHSELLFFQANNYPVAKRSDVLGAITNGAFNICVGGTHGKTTTSTMVAHILRHTGFGCNAFLGGIATNYGTNFWSSERDVCVVEADEYDRSFLKLSPDVAVVTAMDADHLDIYGTEEALQDAFVQFAQGLKKGGLLLHKHGLLRMSEVTGVATVSYSGSNDFADAYAASIQMRQGGYRFDAVLPTGNIEGFELNIGGMHNVENAIAAIAIAAHLEIDADKIRAAVKDFKGVKRRFEYIIAPEAEEQGGYVYPVFIDDYAHHPEELQSLLKSARALFPRRKITVIFQPHLFSRTKDFAAGFGESLSIADEVILLPIYPARELPMEGVSSDMLLRHISREQKTVVQKESLVQWMEQYATGINKEFGEVIITAGAGDIDTLVQPIKQILEKA
ncbi:UDP-N-acetylmuramate--L-alanine ligase [Pseudocnuella soli]|uniref:UDP-N-acetylmuramate--L-alanine ligase n=1 Tax=Pseudocnuella soli TaxID=2502779 RepID=UPI001051B942|nr:UDP-N-acetylmuramate--L-alanine ligase [Pseudocnuella soli]